MHTRVYLAIIAGLALAPACASNPPQPAEALPEATEAQLSVDEVYARRFALEDFWSRLESAKNFYDTDNHYLFASTRDSLVSDVNAYIREHAHVERDPDFASLLNQLSILDTLGTQKEPENYSEKDDSMALSYADWPALDIDLDDGKMFSELNSLFPTVENNRIDFWINYFTGPGRDRFERAIYRMQIYRPVVEKIFDELGLPRELICVALVESGFSTSAVSTARAVGPWQFIGGTARLYGLRHNWWIDERRDIVASTYAAGHYLKDLYDLWSDWHLALAAYNCGEFRVARQVAYQKTTDFWRLRLPRQTERYVPKFLASLYILRDPGKYNIEIPSVVPMTYDPVTITDATDLKVIARCAETSVDTIKKLNPHLRRWATPPSTEVIVRVPRGKGEICRQNLANIPAGDRITWRRHAVRKGETLSEIARKYGTTVSTLKRLNGVRDSRRVRIGQNLLVPLQGGDFAQVASSKPQYMNPGRSIDKDALERYAKRNAPPAGYKKYVYRVRPHDTLGEIAERYHTSAHKLRAWNHLRYRRFIYPGQRLSIYVPESFDPPERPVRRVSRPDASSFVKRTHVVRRGDTFYSISRHYGVPLNDLLSWNRKTSRSVIHPGDVLEIWTKK